MLRRLAQQRMTLSDLEWPFHTFATINGRHEMKKVTSTSSTVQNHSTQLAL